jgi:phosphomannomutase
MLAAITIVGAIKKKGSRVLDQVPSYHQVRLTLEMERKKALASIKKLQRENPDADLLDGIKINVSRRSWVLIRVSGTEDIVRISAESPSLKEAQQLAKSYVGRLKAL